MNAPLPAGNQCTLFGTGCPDLDTVLKVVLVAVCACVFVCLLFAWHLMTKNSCVQRWPFSFRRNRSVDAGRGDE